MNNSRYFFSIFMFVLCGVVIYLFKDFWLAIAIASLISVATANIHLKISKHIKQRALNSFLTTFLVFSFFFAPLVYAGLVLFDSLKNIDIQTAKELMASIKNFDAWLPNFLDFIKPNIEDFLSTIEISNLLNTIISYASFYSKTGINFFIDFGLICVFYFFANYYGKELMIFLKNILPFSQKAKVDILKQVSSVMAVVFYSIIFNAILQGFLFAIITSILGFDGILFGILYAFSSLIPLVGGMLLWLPLSCYLYFLKADSIGAISLVIYSVVLISIVADTFIKPYIIAYISQKLVKTKTILNEMLVFFSMIAGISTFGFWGIILGPAILALFMSVIKIYFALNEEKG